VVKGQLSGAAQEHSPPESQQARPAHVVEARDELARAKKCLAGGGEGGGGLCCDEDGRGRGCGAKLAPSSLISE
jgi:hypothetical protein